MIGKSVLITTKYRGVYHGILKKINHAEQWCVLTEANMARYWGTKGGVDELAYTGPTAQSKVGSLAEEIYLPGLTSVVVCAPKAISAWAKHKC